MNKSLRIAFCLGWLGASMASQAVVFGFASGAHAARAAFVRDGSDLVVTLSNDGGDVLAPTDVLQALFFSIADPNGKIVPLAPVSASVASGSTLVFAADNTVTDIGKYWQYKAVSPYGSNSGLSSTGLSGVFGPQGNFDPIPANLGGTDYGLTSANDDLTTGNSEVTGGNPPQHRVELVKSAAVFVLAGLPNGYQDAWIGNVTFQYGTSLDSTYSYKGGKQDSSTSVPGPYAVIPFLVGLAYGFKRRHR